MLSELLFFLNLNKDAKIEKATLKSRIERVCIKYACIEMHELYKPLINTSGLKTRQRMGKASY